MSITRRSFLKGSAATAALSVVGGSAINVLGAETAALANGPGNKWPGRVVVNFNKSAVTGTTTVNEAVVKQMVDDSIKLLTDQATVGAAWKAVFPSTLSATSKIAIKINILNNGNPAPHAFSVMAITEGLQQMDFGGKPLPPENITIYDMNNSNSMDSAGYTAVRFPKIKRVKDTAQVFGDGALNNRSYAKTLNEHNFLINVFSPRGHSIGSTFTIGFKSHFGTYSNPSGMHSNAAASIRDINCTGPVLNKTVLSICSGIFGMKEGNGPGGGADNYSTYSKKMDSTSTNVNPTTIIMSTDPVSCDMQTIKMMRLNNGKAYTTADLPDYLKAAGGVTGTLTPVYNIGIIEESAMDVRKIINGLGTTSTKSTAPKIIGSTAGITATQLRGQNTTFIEFAVPKSYVNQKASIEIVNLNGTMVRELKCSIQGMTNQISWDQTDLNGRMVSCGTYIVKLKSESLGISTRLTLAR
jgi:hypothetical protein